MPSYRTLWPSFGLVERPRGVLSQYGLQPWLNLYPEGDWTIRRPELCLLPSLGKKNGNVLGTSSTPAGIAVAFDLPLITIDLNPGEFLRRVKHAPLEDSERPIPVRWDAGE